MRKQLEIQQQMYKFIRQWQESGLTQKEYCRQQSIRYHIFHYWYKCFRQDQPGADAGSSAFVKLQIKKPVDTGVVEIYFSNGTRIFFNEPVSSSFLKALVS